MINEEESVGYTALQPVGERERETERERERERERDCTVLSSNVFSFIIKCIAKLTLFTHQPSQ